MTTYIRRSYPAKKIAILEKRERELVNSINSGFAGTKLARVAEKVRTAQLAVIKGKRHYIVDDGHPHFEDFRQVDAERAEWSSKSVQEIVEKYRNNPEINPYPPPPFAST